MVDRSSKWYTVLGFISDSAFLVTRGIQAGAGQTQLAWDVVEGLCASQVSWAW